MSRRKPPQPRGGMLRNPNMPLWRHGNHQYSDPYDRYDGYDPQIWDTRFVSLDEPRADGRVTLHGVIRDRSKPFDPYDDEWHRELAAEAERKVDLSSGLVAAIEAAIGAKLDPELLVALQIEINDVIDNVLTRHERYVLIQRWYGDTYREIAETAWPRLSGPKQAQRLEERAYRRIRERVAGDKLKARLSRRRNDLRPKPDKSDIK